MCSRRRFALVLTVLGRVYADLEIGVAARFVKNALSGRFNRRFVGRLTSTMVRMRFTMVLIRFIIVLCTLIMVLIRLIVVLTRSMIVLVRYMTVLRTVITVL